MLDPWAKTLIPGLCGRVSHVGRANVRREPRRELQRDSLKKASKINLDWIPAWTHLNNSTFLLVLEPRDLGGFEMGSGETPSEVWGHLIGLKGHSKQEKPIIVNLKELHHLSVLREGKTSSEDTIIHLEEKNGSLYIRLPGISGPSRASSLLHLAKENGCSFEQPDIHFEGKTREKKIGTDPSTTLLEQRSGNVDKTASELERLLTLTPEPLVPGVTERAHVADKSEELRERQEVACHPEETAACSASSLPLMSPQGLTIEDGDFLVAPACAGDTYSFIAVSSGTYRCQATDIIFEMSAAGQVHYTWKGFPAGLHREQFIPISSAFDISCDNNSLHALRIPHYLDVEHWKDLSKIKMFHSKDGNINLKDPSEVSATHARVEIQSLSLFALILQLWGVPYRVKAVVLVFKVPGALLKLEVHLIPDDIANINRIRKKLKKEKYEYFQIPTKCHESLTVDESYSLSCDIQVKRIQPENLKMENSCNENNFFHILFKSEFEEFCLTVKEDKHKKSVWQSIIHWQETEGAETPGTEQSLQENYLFNKIRLKLPTLVKCLQCSLTPILNELASSTILTTAEIGEFTAIENNKGGYDAASHLIYRILDKGPSLSAQVWEALWKTRKTYKQLDGLLQEVFPDRY